MHRHVEKEDPVAESESCRICDEVAIKSRLTSGELPYITTKLYFTGLGFEPPESSQGWRGKGVKG